MLIHADLHIHTCLSPCASLEMSPSAIISKAAASGLKLIAVTDHNSPLNCPAFEKIVKQREDIVVFYGMEITTAEEVHVLALFDRLESAMILGEEIYEHLPDIKNVPEKFGDQVYVDQDNFILGEAEKYLLSATDLSLSETLKRTHELGGLFIPAHIDREFFGLIAQLGFIPREEFDAVELSRYHRRNSQNQIKGIDLFTAITNSDSHYLTDIGTAYSEFEIDELSISALKETLFRKRVRPVFLP